MVVIIMLAPDILFFPKGSNLYAAAIGMILNGHHNMFRLSF